MPAFNLVSEPWIPVLDPAGEPRLVGIREALLRAHEIGRISPVSPLAEAAIHRLLLAVLHRALRGPSDVMETVQIYQAGRFPEAPIEAYLSRWADRFELFHRDHPFYQVPDLPVDDPDPWVKLLPEFSSGNNPTLFDHTMDDSPPAASPAEAAVALLVHQSFVPGGLIQRLGVRSGKAAPFGDAAIFLPQGETLFETLVLNLVPYRGADEDDEPIWEREPYRKVSVERGKAREEVRGLTRIYTWMSRAVRLQLDEDGMVRRMDYGPGVEPVDVGAVDPMRAYQRSGKAPSPYRLPEDKSFWRDFEALLPGESGWQPPQVLEHAREFLRRTGRTSVLFHIVVVGQCTKQAKVYDVRREVYPLSVRALDPEPAGRIRDALRLAREGGDALDAAGKVLAVHLLSSGLRGEEISQFVKSLPLDRTYWSGLEARFLQFLEKLTGHEPKAALEGWKSAVRHAVYHAWDVTVRTVGVMPRHLRAVARGGGQTCKGHQQEDCSMTRAGSDKPARFVQYLRELLDSEKNRDSRGAAAALRRILAATDPGDPGEVRAYRYVEPFADGEDPWRRRAYYLVAGLYAMHPVEDRQTLAQALSRVWRRGAQRRRLESRFLALLGADPDQLPDQLRRAVMYLRSEGEGFDYSCLLADILDWNRPDRRVQWRWSQEFYRAEDSEGQQDMPGDMGVER